MTNPVPADVVKIGDTITAQFLEDCAETNGPEDLLTITGKVRPAVDGDLWLGGWIVAHNNGNPGPNLVCVIERTPAEPPVGTVLLDQDGDYWAHVPDGWVCIEARASRGQWKNIAGRYDLSVVDA